MGVLADAMLFSLIHDYFKVYLPNQKHCSPHTIRAYQFALTSLLEFVKTKKGITLSCVTFKMIDSVTLSEYLEQLESKHGCSVRTRNHRLNCIRAFYAYVAMMEPTAVIHKNEISKIPLKKIDMEKIIDYMNEAAVSALMAQPDTKTKKGLRDQFLMIMLYDTAARIQEMLDFRICDLHMGKNATATLFGKGLKQRTTPIMEETIAHFKNYARVFHPDENMYSKKLLFYTIRNGTEHRMSQDNARRLISAYGAAGKEKCLDIPDDVHPHLFRHSRSMHLYQKGMDLTLLSQWLGHAQLETTLMYAYADTEHKRKAIEKATDQSNPLKARLNSQRFVTDDEDILKKLYGLI